MKLLFSGTAYTCSAFTLTQPGEVEVSDAKAQQLLTDFPELFSKIEPPAQKGT